MKNINNVQDLSSDTRHWELIMGYYTL